MVKVYVSMNGARELSSINSALEAAVTSGADGLHFDVIDGSVGGQPATIDAFEPRYIGKVREYAKSARNGIELPISIHILTSNPVALAAQYLAKGVSRIILPYKAFNDADALLAALKKVRDGAGFDKKKMKIGTSFSPTECKEKFSVSRFSIADFVDIVASGPGLDMAPAPPLLPEVVRDVYAQREAVRRQYSWFDFDIAVQGGITSCNVSEIKKAGADILVLGRDFIEMKGGHAAYVESVRHV